MTDTINSVCANSDGSYDFAFTFDNGSGMTGETNVHVPALQPTTDSNGNTVAAVPYTMATARAAAIPIAVAQKANWMNSINAASVVGPVTL